MAERVEFDGQPAVANVESTARRVGMAVGGVWGELVSEANSLIYRESTGKFSKIRLLGWNQRWLSRAFPQPRRAIPGSQEQGICFGEQGIPDTRCRRPGCGHVAHFVSELSIGRVLGTTEKGIDSDSVPNNDRA